MSITLTLYNQSSPTNKINKNLGGALGTVVANPNGTINVLDPVFIIDSLDAASYSNLGNCNYLVAGAPLNRRYFVVSVDFTVAKTAIITCHCDVLSTYASQLGTLNFVRGAGDINEMDDSSYPISDYMVQQYYPMSNWTDIFKNTGSGRQFLLRTVKGTVEETDVYDANINSVLWCGDTYMDNNDTIHYIVYFISGISGTNKLKVEKTYQSNLSPGVIQLQDNDYLRIPNPNYTDRTGLWQYTGGILDLKPDATGAWSYKGLI